MVLTQAETALYHPRVFKVQVASGRRDLILPCPLGRHTDPIVIDLTIVL
jgi:hypothetical protein